MSKFLVIVESPAKSKTIEGYLGRDYRVESSLGHVRDLPSKAPSGSPRKWMGVDPDNGWKAEYAVSEGHQKLVAGLKKVAKGAEAVYLATDPDREGEAIAWHLAEVLADGGSRKSPADFRRVVFNEITRDAVRRSFANPGQIDMRLVEAQKSRRFLDRVLGYRLSPLLWKKRLSGSSAGRVQSVALRLLVERDRAIRAFVPEELWEIWAPFEVAGQELRFRLTRLDGKKFQASSREQADQHLAKLRQLLQDARIAERDDRPLSPRPGAPFITSSLQRTASTRLSLSIQNTMRLAQSLYEAGLITYMRTDSTHLSKEAVQAARKQIAAQFPASGKDSYLPDRPRVYASRSGAQESHEAIRPTRADLPAADLPASVDARARQLYDLIYRRFIACQMANSRLLSTRLRVLEGGYELEVRGQVTLFDGFLKVWPEGVAQDVALPAVQAGEPARLLEVEGIRKFTQPPRRYTEATLVRELEKHGIGRPSTYAAIVSTLKKRGYTRLEKRHFFVERLGEVVCMRLEQSFPELMDYGYTAEMEKNLDRVAQGEIDWRSLLDDFYRRFSEQLERASDPETGMPKVGSVETEVPCELCGRPMVLRLGRAGLFLGCSGYRRTTAAATDADDSCKGTRNLAEVPRTAPAEAEDAEADTSESPAELLGRNCDKCGEPALVFQLDPSRRLWVCSRSPDCDWTQPEAGNFAPNQSAPTRLRIPIENLPCRDHPDDHYVLVEGRNGLFLAASGWPKHKETRSILVRELPLVEAGLGEKFAHLLRAPAQDPDGRDTEVAFSRKFQSHYVRTAELSRDEAGWAANYDSRTAEWKPMKKALPRTAAGKSPRSRTGSKSTASPRQSGAGKRAAAGSTSSGRSGASKASGRTAGKKSGDRSSAGKASGRAASRSTGRAAKGSAAGSGQSGAGTASGRTARDGSAGESSGRSGARKVPGRGARKKPS